MNGHVIPIVTSPCLFDSYPTRSTPHGRRWHLAWLTGCRHTLVDRLRLAARVPSTRCMSVREKSDRPKLQLHHSPVEIERKFLVANDEWRQSAVRSVSIRDGLIALYKDHRCGSGYPETSRRSLSKDRGPALCARNLSMRSRSLTPRECSQPCVRTTPWKSSVSLSRKLEQRGRLMFTAAFSKASLLPKSSLS